MPCSLSVPLSVQRSPLSDSRLVTYLCSPISSLFNLSSFLRCSMGHFHYGMLCAFPPSVCTCVIYNADQEGGMWKISREVRASSRPGQSKQLLWAVGYGDRRAACGPAVTTCGLFLRHSLCRQAGCMSCHHPTMAEGGLGCRAADGDGQELLQ